MIDIIWSVRLKLKAMLKEVKWGLSLKRYSIKRLKELSLLISRLFFVQTIILASDVVKFTQFTKEMISKKMIFIPLIVMLTLFGFYLSLISGKPDKEFFEEKLFPKFYYNTAVEIRDQENRLAGTTHQPQSLVNNPSLFIAKTPTLFWSLLKEKYDPYLNFESNATSFYKALFENPRYYNGIDIATPLVDSKKLLVRFITEQDLSTKPTLTLTQQLVNLFLKKYPLDKSTNNIERLKLAKTFFCSFKELFSLYGFAYIATKITC